MTFSQKLLRVLFMLGATLFCMHVVQPFALGYRLLIGAVFVWGTMFHD